MPRTLTSAVQQAITARDYGYDVLIESAAIGLKLSWFFAPDATWEHRLLHVDPLEVGIPPGGGVGYISQLAFTYAEDGTGQSLLLLDEGPNILNAIVTLKILFAGEAYIDAVPLFYGRIESWDVENGEATITAVDDRLHRDIQLPKTVVTRIQFPNAPDESLSRAIPLVYGDGNILNPVPMLLVDTVNSVYQVSEHPCLALPAIYGPWPEGGSALKIFRASATDALVIESNKLRLLRKITDTRFGQDRAVGSLLSASGVLNPANILGTDPTTIATFQTDGSTGDSQAIYHYALTEPVGLNVFDIQVLQHGLSAGAPATLSGRMILDTLEPNLTRNTGGLWTLPEVRRRTIIDELFHVTGVALGDQNLLRLTIAAQNEGGPGSGSYQVAAVIIDGAYMVAGPFEPIYLPDVSRFITGVFAENVFEGDVFEQTFSDIFQGRADDDAGTITGTPGTVFALPPDILTSLMVQELGLAMDATSLTAARTARGNWRLSGGIGAGWFRERTGALDLLHTVCLQGGMYLYPTGDGTYTCTALNPQATPTFTIGPGGSAEDFLLYHATDPAAPAQAWRRSLRYRGGRADAIRNRFEIPFRWHAAKQQFQGIASASIHGLTDQTGQFDSGLMDLLQASYSLFGERPVYQLDGDFLYHADTVHKLLNILVQYWAFPRHEVEFDTTFAPLAVQLGETIGMDTDGMPLPMRGQPFEVDRIRYDFDQGRMALHGTQRRRIRLDYYAMRDQSGVIWYLWIDGIRQQLVRDNAPPDFTFAVEVDLTPDPIPYWLAITDETLTTQYVYPADATEQMIVDSTQPPIGTGVTGSPQWTAFDGRIYVLRTRSTQQYEVGLA